MERISDELFGQRVSSSANRQQFYKFYNLLIQSNTASFYINKADNIYNYQDLRFRNFCLSLVVCRERGAIPQSRSESAFVRQESSMETVL